MSTATPLWAAIDLAGWDADTRYAEEHVELVRGILSVSPGESFGNRRVCDTVLITLAKVTPPGWVPVSELAVTLAGDPVPTVRRPDVMVLAAGAPRGWSRHDPADVALVVEVVSPTSRERDLVWKVGEYAAAGIPNYLVVDPESATLTLHSRPGAGGYVQTRGGSTVTWVLDGLPVLLSIADFLG